MIVKSSYSSTKLITSDSDVEGTFKSMHQSIMTKNKKLCLWRLSCLGCNYKEHY